MYIQVDTRQKPKRHNLRKEQYFESQGYDVIRSKLICGDYALPAKMDVVVDTKQNCLELYSDLITDHQRFKNECRTAQECGIELFVLVENTQGFACCEDILHWKNPLYRNYLKRKSKAEAAGQRLPWPPANNNKLFKIMNTMSALYGVEFLFCDPSAAGAVIINLLKYQSMEDPHEDH